MEEIRGYLLGVIAAGVFCFIVDAVSPQKGINRNLIKTLCGIFVLLTAFRPVIDMPYWEFNGFLPAFSELGQAAAEQGESFAREALEEGIKKRTEAYILDKAENYDAQLEVEVSIKWTDTPIPAEVVITGACSPYAKSQLSAMMEQDLGISIKDQLWRT